MQGELYLVDESGQDVCFPLNYRRRKTRNNANSLSHQAFYLPVWPRAVLEIFTYDMYARFLRAIHVQTACNNYAHWDSFKSGEYATHFSTIIAPTAVLAGLPCLALLGCVQSHNKPALIRQQKKKFRFINWLTIFLRM